MTPQYEALAAKVEGAEGASERTPESLTPAERRFCKRRFCGWCEARLDSNTCFAQVDATDNRCTAAERNVVRANALATYRPRPRAQAALSSEMTNG